MIDDRERDEHGPAPGRHFVNVKRRPFRQQNHLHRNGGQILPGKLPEQREIELAEGVHARDAAETQNVGARFLHERQIGRMTRQLQCEVRLDRCVHFARPAVINIPTAIRELALQNVANAALLQPIVHLPQPMHEEDEIGAERAIDEQFAAPMAIRMLLPQQIFLAARHGARNLGVTREIGRGGIGNGARQRDEVRGRRRHCEVRKLVRRARLFFP